MLLCFSLKARKISPVLINQNIFLLVELKRPPNIFETRNANCMFGDASEENRVPGTRLMGYANTWIFRLSPENSPDKYISLCYLLRRYNLLTRQFSENKIKSLTRSKEDIRKTLESVLLLSNDEWVKQNQNKVDDFLQNRWASYPFETKFEIMKLISKHIISVNDLIIDEHAECILKVCTINTLIAITGKSREFVFTNAKLFLYSYR